VYCGAIFKPFLHGPIRSASSPRIREPSTSWSHHIPLSVLIRLGIQVGLASFTVDVIHEVNTKREQIAADDLGAQFGIYQSGFLAIILTHSLFSERPKDLTILQRTGMASRSMLIVDRYLLLNSEALEISYPRHSIRFLVATFTSWFGRFLTLRQGRVD
jgi:hypothetical protein